MMRILFLILVLMSSVAFAQTEDKPKAIKFNEFETATGGYIKMNMDAFYIELANDPAAQGYIFNFGTDKEIAVREKQIVNAISFRKYDSSRVTMVKAGFWKVVKTEFWLVPAGAENPQPASKAEKFDEFGKINDEVLSLKLDIFFISIANDPNALGYILNFGTEKVISARERRIKNYLLMRKLDLSRIIFKKAGYSDVGRTSFWIIRPDNKNE